MIQNGVPLEYVSRVLNHGTKEMTRVYARITQDNQREALTVASQVLDGIFGEIAA